MTPEALLAEARAHLDQAYVPYSRFPVAAAVLDEQGRVFWGVNVENASSGLTMCAERLAIYSAVAAGARSIQAIAVSAAKIHPVSPCGVCRQVMSEFCAPDVPVISDAGNGAHVKWTVAELLPHAFSASAFKLRGK